MHTLLCLLGVIHSMVLRELITHNIHGFFAGAAQAVMEGSALCDQEQTTTKHNNAGVVGIGSSPTGQNGRHFADDIFRCIFMNENFCSFIKISPMFVPKGPIDNNPAWV